MSFSGFCIGGTDWFRPELVGVDDPSEQSHIRREVVAGEARMTRRLGGNLLRVFFDIAGLLPGDRAAAEVALGSSVSVAMADGSVPSSGLGLHRAPVEERVARLDAVMTNLDTLLAAVDPGGAQEPCLDSAAMDDVIGGVVDANEGCDDSEAVRVLLTLVAPAPRWIVEAPSAATLRAHGRDYTFQSLWERYLALSEDIHRLLVRRYVGDQWADGPPVVVAFEIGNEPDYVWVPEEVKIEGSSDPLLYPLSKYVTELQLGQVPERPEQAPGLQATAWGFQAEDGEWLAEADDTVVPVSDFDWGAKFDWYVRCFAQLQERVADAISAEAAGLGGSLEIVSGSVTHNNIDYLMRMHRANPRAFASVTKLGIHPYHWVRNDVWDDRFVDASPTGGWIKASPRAYAGDYFKRFDFLEELARCIKGVGVGGARELRSFSKAIRGKKLWITEFGIGTKVLGAFNAPIAEYTRFIRPRDGVGLAAGHGAAVWEDLWEAFLAQADAAYLERNQVDGLILYSLREIGTAGLDMDDDDRSNLAILHRDGTSRLDQATLEGVSELLADVAGRDRESAREHSSAAVELHRRPWRSKSLPQTVLDTTTMLSVEERQLLAWLTSSYWKDVGAIVDGGSFLGGSTVALGTGLRENSRLRPDVRIDVFDMFEVEPYMSDLYLGDHGLVAGDSFRPLFDIETAAVADLLEVHEGDLTRIGWDGRPIEILFVDIAKSWSLNDVLIRDFFPCLLPDHSVVVHQDYAFAFQPWIAIAMERLSAYFRPVAFAEHNTVVFVCTRPVPHDVLDGSLADLAAAEKFALLDKAARRFRGYPRAALDAGRAVLLMERGDLDAARAELRRIRELYAADEVALQAMTLLESALVPGS